VDRVIDVFPPHQQQQMRVQLASTLKAVICQQLLPRADGRGRVAARELMIVTHAISNLYQGREDAPDILRDRDRSKAGMSTLESSLAELVRDKLITIDDAFSSQQPRHLEAQACLYGHQDPINRELIMTIDDYLKELMEKGGQRPASAHRTLSNH